MGTYYVDYVNGSDSVLGTVPFGSATRSFETVGATLTSLTNSNLTATATGASGSVKANCGFNNSHKVYWEVVIGTQFGGMIGCSQYNTALNGAIGNDSTSIGYRRATGLVISQTTTKATVATATFGDTVSIAVNMPAKLIWFRVNGGNWNNTVGADPATNTGGIDISFMTGIGTSPTSGMAPHVSWAATGDKVTINLATPTQTVPTGYTTAASWSTALQSFNGLGNSVWRNYAAGDVYRIAKSPDPTSLGQTAQWTDANQVKLNATRTISAATNASPIVCTTSAAHGWSTGDYVWISGATSNTAVNGPNQITVIDTTHFSLNGSTGNGAAAGSITAKWWTNHFVTLTTAVTANIDRCETVWTTANGTTCTVDTSNVREGLSSAKLVVPATTANTLYAYHALGSTVDFSAYQQISFWLMNSVAMTAAGRFTLCLCSDAAGATVVNSAPFPYSSATAAWQPVTVDFGAPLGSSIQSIAVYCGPTALATITLNIDNVIACKASSSPDALSLTSLISKNTNNEGWWAIQSINGTAIKIDQTVNVLPSNGRGYAGVTENVTTYMRNVISTFNNLTTFTTSTAGTAVALMDYEGGYNISTNVQDGDSFFDGLTGSQIGLSCSNAFSTFNKLNFVRYNTPVSLNSSFINFTGHTVGFAVGNGVNFSSAILGYCNIAITNILNCGSFNAGISMNGAFNVVTSTNVMGHQSNNVSLSGIGNVLYITNCKNSSSSGFTVGNMGANNIVIGTTFANNSNTSVSMGAGGVSTTFKNCTISDASEFTGTGPSYNDRIIFHNYNNVAGSHKIDSNGMTIVNDTTTVHTAGGMSWKITPTSNSARSLLAPCDLVIARVYVTAGSPVTASVWLRRSVATVFGLLAVRANQLAGVPQTTAAMSAAINTWQQVTLSFTPTETGVIAFEAWAYSTLTTTDSLWVDDFSVSQ